MKSRFHSRPHRVPAWAPWMLLAGLISLLFPSPALAAGRQALHGHVPEALGRLAPVGRVDARQHLKLAIGLPLRNQQALDDLIHNLYDPASPSYRHYLTTAQFTAEFGPTQQDYEAVAAFAKAHGLTVTNRYSNRVVLDVEGAVSDIEKALHVTIRVYRHPTEARTFYAPDAEPSLDLAVPISHIHGLDNYALPKPRLKPSPAMPAHGTAIPHTGTGPNGTYMGNDFRTAYVPGVSLTGSGQTVGLLQFDGYTASDITYYESKTGRSAVTLQNVLLDGFNGTPTGNGGEVEVSLDIEMVISMAPGVSKIILYEAGPNGVFDDILSRMVSDNTAKQIGCSWGYNSSFVDSTADSLFQQMATQGQSFYNASGDSDAFVGAIDFPSEDPYITQVGGTTLTTNGAGGAYTSETVWNWGYDSNAGGYVGSSGGVSTHYSIPTWQKGISMTANKGSTTKRNVPDVALTADNVYVRADGQDLDEGGTSCAAPLWAAFTALVNQQGAANGQGTVGFVAPALYTIGKGSNYATDFHDITTGNNFSSSSPSKFSAVTGYDLCTGWGTPAGAALINALAPLSSEGLQVSSTSGFVSSGGVGGPFAPHSKSYTVSNTGSSSLTWKAGATQSWLSLSATSGTLAASGSATVTASINSNANALASGTYSDTITFTDTGTGYTQTRAVSLTVVATPVITSTLAATVTDGVAFSYQITATNSPTSFAASGLPSGLSVNTTSGLISGTASATGTSSVTISAINAGGTGSATLVLTVLPPPPVITSALAATVANGVAFSYQITASNSPTSFAASGLPAGLSVDPIAGMISGTTTATGTSNVIISAINAGGTGSAVLALTLLPAPPAITSTLAASAASGAAFSYQITATNSPTSFNASGLPSGLSVNTASGVISGTTTATGTSSVTISASNAGGTGFATLALTVLPPPPVITSTLAATAANGAAFSYQIAATNSPTSFNASGLPSGLSVNTASGLISGTASATGTSSVTISAINAGGTGSAILTLAVLPPPPVITSALAATAANGVAFSYQITATNSPTSFAASGLPSRLNVDPIAGVISGATTATGTSSVTISASNTGGTGSATLTLTVLPPLPVITSTLSATGTAGYAFTYQITASNNPAGFAANGLPSGLSVDPASGIISGTAASTGTSNVTISAINASGTGSATLALSMVPGPPVITSTLSATAIIGSPFAYSITASSSPTSYNAAGLPGGLSVNTATGLISGTCSPIGPNGNPNYTVTIYAANASGTGTASLALLVETPYAAWQSEFFPIASLATPSVSSDTADPAGDGIPNLMKYALNLNPWIDGVSGLPVESIITTGSGNYLTLTYTQVIAATDITYTVQVSTDLQTWNSGSGYTTAPSATNNADGVTQSVTVQAVAPLDINTPTQFIRLQVTGP